MVSYFHPKPRTTGTLSGASVPAGRSRGPWEPGVATGPDVGSAGATQMHVKVAGCGSRCRCLEHGPLHHTEPHGTTRHHIDFDCTVLFATHLTFVGAIINLYSTDICMFWKLWEIAQGRIVSTYQLLVWLRTIQSSLVKKVYGIRVLDKEKERSRTFFYTVPSFYSGKCVKNILTTVIKIIYNKTVTCNLL